MPTMNRRQFLQSSAALAVAGNCSASLGMTAPMSHGQSRKLLRGMGGWGRHIVSLFAQSHSQVARSCLIEFFERTDVLGLRSTGFPYAAVSSEEPGIARPITPQLSIRKGGGEILMYVGALGRVTGGSWSCEFAECVYPASVRQYGVFLMPSRAKPPRFDLNQMALYDRAISHLSRLQSSLERSVFIHVDDVASHEESDRQARIEAHAVGCIAEILA